MQACGRTTPPESQDGQYSDLLSQPVPHPPSPLDGVGMKTRDGVVARRATDRRCPGPMTHVCFPILMGGKYAWS